MDNQMNGTATRFLLISVIVIQAALGWWNYTLSHEIAVNSGASLRNADVVERNRQALLAIEASSNERSKKLDRVIELLTEGGCGKN